jgi:periplasmic divalent cation tolerance protein
MGRSCDSGRTPSRIDHDRREARAGDCRRQGRGGAYRWQGEISRDEEHLLLIKTTRERSAALERRVRELHSYEVPEVIVLPIESGSEPYLSWRRQQVD